ncbi:MAG TPA: RNase adapter RapZ [Burkholderiaceae bacterium]|nr:RNase adapter RapZ [Burkholderiaceae bacterium]
MRSSLVLITGVSGAGKSVALKALEDAGYYCVDNLPAPVIADLMAHLDAQGEAKVAIAIDARSGKSVADLPHIVTGLKTVNALGEQDQQGRDVRVLFLTANSTALVQRFSETRRRHPLSPSGPMADAQTPSLVEAIERERELVGDLAELGRVIDTSSLSPSKLRAAVKEFIDHDVGGLTLMFESFAFKRGVPLDADLVFDVRFLPNPYYDTALRPLTGLDAPVIEFMQSLPDAERLLADIERFLSDWLPSYQRDHRSYLTVAIGCTGGQHRSVWACEQLAKRLRGQAAHVITRHREME